MKKEHCEKEGSKELFTTPNYGVTTYPAIEWAFVEGTEQCPVEDLKKKIWIEESNQWKSESNGKVIRRIRSLAELKLEEDMDCRQLISNAKLGDEEIVAVTMYTGPMYLILNLILRQYPRKRDLKDGKGYPYYEFFESGNNLYSTSICVLVSAIQKIARVMKLPPGLKLYRGMGGDVELPAHFYKADEYGRRGFAEWGFLSTTSSKAAAIDYSGITARKALPMLYQAVTSSVDRGACIKDLSQYPAEVEYLWAPCSFLQPDGAEALEVVDEGVVTVVPLRINANLKAKTLDELTGEKKSLHIASFNHLRQEMRRDFLEHSADTGVRAYLDGVLGEAESVYARHDGADAARCSDF